MATRSRHFMSRTSGIALAAFVVASMSVHDHQAALNTQNAALTSVDRHSQPLHVTNIDFDGIVPNIIHHY